MTPLDIIARLFESQKGVTRVRVEKAKALASRVKLEWGTVYATMTDAQRKAVDRAGEV